MEKSFQEDEEWRGRRDRRKEQDEVIRIIVKESIFLS